MRKIVIIDDDASLRGTLRVLLEKRGYTVAEAENGRDGIKKVESVGADLVLTDVIMPDQDGIETVQILRKTYPGTKVIAMSGGGSFRMNELLTMATKLGAEGRLEKPFTSEEVLKEIDRVLQHDSRAQPDRPS
jgi:DNA-binding NtrC family response regulator